MHCSNKVYSLDISKFKGTSWNFKVTSPKEKYKASERLSKRRNERQLVFFT